MRILVVEDDASICEALQDILEFEDYSVHCENDGQKALAWLQRNPRPSVILLDLMMPVMDGFCFRREQLKDPEIANIPVIVITATRPAQISSLSFHRILYKPISVEKLTDAIRSVPLESDYRTTESTWPGVDEDE